MLITIKLALSINMCNFLLQGSSKQVDQAGENLSVDDFIASTLPLLELEKNAEVAQVCCGYLSIYCRRAPCSIHS